MAPSAGARELQIRWLGRVGYNDAWALQRSIFATSATDHLLLLEHPHVFTLGLSGDDTNILVTPGGVDAEVVRVDRGGDVTYHGPGQLVGYPLLTVRGKRGGGMADTVKYVGSVEQVLIDALAELGLRGAGRLREYPGVWLDPESDDPRKIAAIGVKLSRGRTMHGFALNVAPDMAYFEHIVPCGIADKAVTSMAREGVDVSMRDVVDVVAETAARRWGPGGWRRADHVWRLDVADLSPFSRGEGPGQPVAQVADGPSIRLLGRLAEATAQTDSSAAAAAVEPVRLADRKPEWMRVKADMGPDYRRLKKTMRSLDLVTVCEEAGCPNIFDCWNDGTATFMINGERCTRACGFCLVDTRKPEPLELDEPQRVAEAVEQMGLSFAVITAVARDDLDDGGAQAFADTIAAIRRRTPDVQVEVLIPDCKGSEKALTTVFEARPDVLNHNIETVLRLQRAVRPSAGYARSLAVLARAKAAGLVTKSSIIVGMGETNDEVVETMIDLSGVGVDIVTIGQYLRPTSNHLPIARWWHPDEFVEMKRLGEAMGIGHVEASPLTRSSYHARQAADAAEIRRPATAAGPTSMDGPDVR